MAALFSFAITEIPSAEAECNAVSEANPVTFFGTLVDDGTELHWNSENLYDVEDEFGEPIRYFRARLKFDDPNALVTIRDSDYRVIQIVAPRGPGDGDEFLTRRIYEPRVFFEVGESTGKSGVVGIIEQVIAVPTEAKFPYYSVKVEGDAKWQDLYGDAVAERVRKLGDFVGLIYLNYGQTFWSCSGTAIGENLFLTNWHCGGVRLKPELGDSVPWSSFWEEDICEVAVVDMSWDDDDRSREFRCDKVLFASRELDLAILSLESAGFDTNLSSASLGSTATDGTPIWMIHHPDALRKKVSNDDCGVESWQYLLDAEPTNDLSHNCDSAGGSSGAPLFNADGEVVGVHHLGFRVDPDQDCAVVERVNRAVRIDTLKQRLLTESQDPATSDEKRQGIEEILRQVGWSPAG